MEPIGLFRFLGVVSLLTLFLGLGYIVRRWGKVSILSLSKHAARQRESRKVFRASLTLSVVFFALFGFGWLMPALHLGPFFGMLLGLALACALVAGLVPDVGGREGRIHGVAAWTMAACMPVIVVWLLLAPEVTTLARFFIAVILSYLILDWILFTFATWSRRFFLIFQASYVLCFYLAVLVAAHF